MKICSCSFSTRIQILWFMLDVEKEETKWQRFAVKFPLSVLFAVRITIFIL